MYGELVADVPCHDLALGVELLYIIENGKNLLTTKNGKNLISMM